MHLSGPRAWNSELFAERLNLLFENGLGPDGCPYTTDEVVRALQYEGIPISLDELSELRRGTGKKPKSRTVKSIAFFFNVTLDYLTDGTGAEYQADKTEAMSAIAKQPPYQREPVRQPCYPARAHENVNRYLSLDDFGKCIAGLSRAIRVEMGESHLDIEMVRRLSHLLEQAGQMLEAAGAGPVSISREFLEQVMIAWAVGGSGGDARYETYARIARTFEELRGD
jgi:hypothetical protein